MNTGNLIWKSDGWYIDGTDKVNVGEVIEVSQSDGSWRKIKVSKNAQEVFHSEPAGETFKAGIQVRRPEIIS